MWKKTTLENGLRIVTEEVPYVHSAVVGIWVKAGSRNENDKNHGISHLIEHLLFKGTEKRTAKQIAQELETVGGSINAFTTKEYTCYYAKVLDEHIDLAVDILADMFFNSLFDEQEIAKEKNVIIEEIKMYEDSPDELIHDLFAQTVLRNHPLGRTIIGTKESVNSITLSDILSYMNENYTPNNTVIAAAGNISHERIVDKLIKLFGSWTGNLVETPYLQPDHNSETVLIKKDTEQVQICLGVPGLPRDNDDTYTLYVLNNILGGGLSSRLFQEIRENQGLAYSIYSYHSSYNDGGLFTIYAGTSPEKFVEVVELVAKELYKCNKFGIGQEELERTKTQIKGNLLLSMESISNRMSRLGRTELCYGRIIPAEEIVEKTSKVTVSQAMDLVENLFRKDKFTLTALGPITKSLIIQDVLQAVGF